MLYSSSNIGGDKTSMATKTNPPPPPPQLSDDLQQLKTLKINTSIMNSITNNKSTSKIPSIRPKPENGSMYSIDESNSMSLSNSSLYPPLYHGTQLSTLNDPLEDGCPSSSSSSSNYSSSSSSFQKTSLQMNRMSKTILANLLSQNKDSENNKIKTRDHMDSQNSSRHQYTGCRYDLAKPPFSYASLIAQALLAAKDRKLTLNQIYDWIMEKYPYYQSENSGWQNSIRHNLSLNSCFEKIPRTHQEKVASAIAQQRIDQHNICNSSSSGGQSSNASGKGCFWTVNMEELASFTDGAFKRRKLHNNPSAGTNSMTRKRKNVNDDGDGDGEGNNDGNNGDGGHGGHHNNYYKYKAQKESFLETPKSLTEEYDSPEDLEPYTAALRLKIFDWECMEDENNSKGNVYNGEVAISGGGLVMSKPAPQQIMTHNNSLLNGSNICLNVLDCEDGSEEAEIYNTALRISGRDIKTPKIPHPELFYIQRWELQKSMNSDLRTDASDPLDILNAKENN